MQLRAHNHSTVTESVNLCVLLKCTQHTTYTQDSSWAHNSVKCQSLQPWSAQATHTCHGLIMDRDLGFWWVLCNLYYSNTGCIFKWLLYWSHIEQQPPTTSLQLKHLLIYSSVDAAAIAYAKKHGRGQLGDWTTIASIKTSHVSLLLGLRQSLTPYQLYEAKCTLIKLNETTGK